MTCMFATFVCIFVTKRFLQFWKKTENIVFFLTWLLSSPQACHNFSILDVPESGLSTPRHCSTRTSCLEVDLTSWPEAAEDLAACALTSECRTSWQVVRREIPLTHLARSWKKKGISAMFAMPGN